MLVKAPITQSWIILGSLFAIETAGVVFIGGVAVRFLPWPPLLTGLVMGGVLLLALAASLFLFAVLAISSMASEEEDRALSSGD